MPLNADAEKVAGSPTDRFKFIGRESQKETNWIDLQARFYDPQIGRFLAVDPVTEGQDAYSPYHYSFGNPIRFSDPDGREPCCGEAVGGFVSGLKEAVVRNVKALTVNLPETIQGMSSFTTPSGQIEALVGGAMLYEKTKNDWNTGDPRVQGNIVGNITGEIGIAVAGSKGLSSLGKVGAASEILSLESSAIRFSQSSVNGVAE